MDNFKKAKKYKKYSDNITNIRKDLLEVLQYRKDDGETYLALCANMSRLNNMFFDYCSGIGKTELEKLGYDVNIDIKNEVVKISW